MAGLTKLLREDLERQYRLAYRVDDISKLTDGAKEALKRNYRPTPPGYHWRWDGKQLEVVRNPDGVVRSKLIYDEVGHRFIVDEGAGALSKRFGDMKAPEAFIDLGGKDAGSEFGKFVKILEEELKIPAKQLVEDLEKFYPKGVKDLTHDTVRHKLKAKYVDMLFAKITNVSELTKTAKFKEVLAATGDTNKALRAASHEELMKLSAKLGPSDKGALGERWFKEWFASRGDTVAKQVTLGPEHGIKHAASRRVDIFEDHLAREMKNVTGHVGKEGTDQLEDLMAGIGKEVTVDGAKTGYDSVRWVFLDPVGGAANASWMVEQLGKYNSGLSFQVLNKEGIPKVLTRADLDKLGADELKKIILEWTKVKPKLHGLPSSDPDEREADAMADKVVQRKCDSCADEEKVQRKENAGAASTTSRTETALSASARGGNPLPQQVGGMMSHAFGFDFSNVRVHNDASANHLSSDLNAKAFTHGNDIYFNSGQFDTNSDSGKHLLAHELTHVVQQNDDAGKMIQKDDDDAAAADPVSTNPLYDALEDVYVEISEEADNSADNGDRAWLRRQALLIQMHMDAAETVPTTFASDAELEEAVTSMVETVAVDAETEQTTMDIVAAARGVEAKPETFLDNPVFLENLNAFPLACWKILAPLIQVPAGELDRAHSEAEEAQRLHQMAGGEMSGYMFEHGLPVNKERSKELFSYELIKSGKFSQRILSNSLYLKRPTWESDLDFLIMPEEKNLHAGYFRLYQQSWTNFLIKKYNDTAYKGWLAGYKNMHGEVMSGNMPPINVAKLKAFQEKNADGLHSIDDLMQLGGGGGAVLDLAQLLMVYAGNFDPEGFLLSVKTSAMYQAATEASSFISSEIARFSGYQYSASSKVQGMEPNDRLFKAIHWSLQQGFTQQSIEAVINNFDDMVIDMLKEMAEESILKKVVSFIASLHPIGRIVAIAYTVYQTTKEIKEALDVVDTIRQVAGIIADARESKSVVDMQRAAGRLAFAAELLIPLIIEKLTESMAQKMMAKKLKNANKTPDPVATPDTSTTTTPPTTTTQAPQAPTPGKTVDTPPTSNKTGTTTTVDPTKAPTTTTTPDKTTTPDTVTAPGKPDKSNTNTNTKVHADPPKTLAETTFKIGNEVHTSRIVEIGGKRQIWICSTCGNLVGKLDEAIAEAGATSPAGIKLDQYRKSALSLEQKLNSGKKIDPAAVNKKVGRIAFEVNKIARANPDIKSLNKILQEDLERQYLATYGAATIDDLTPASKAAMARQYRPTPPGYHWRQTDDGNLEVVRNRQKQGEPAPAVEKSKLIYNDKEHRFEVDPGRTTTSKRFDKNMTPQEAFDALSRDDPDSQFSKFVNTVSNELQISPDDMKRVLARQNPQGFNGKSYDTVRHNLKKTFTDSLYEKTKNRQELVKSDAYRQELALSGDVEKAFKAASHKKMLDISRTLGNADKGSLGERWYKENYADRGGEVKTQVTLGPEHGITHENSRRVDIYDNHMAREVKNVTEPLGDKGTKQVDDLLAAADKDIKVGNSKTGYDTVQLTFIDPIGGAANASWMAKQLDTYMEIGRASCRERV